MIHPHHIAAADTDAQYHFAFNRRVAEVGTACGLTCYTLLGKSRKRAHAWPRQMLMWHLSKEDGIPIKVISRLMGLDHSSVIHGIRAHGERAGIVWPACIRRETQQAGQ